MKIFSKPFVYKNQPTTVHKQKTTPKQHIQIEKSTLPALVLFTSAVLCLKNKNTLNKIITKTLKALKNTFKKPKQPNKILTGTHKINIITKTDLERRLKGVNLHDPQAIEDALRKIPGIKIKNGNFRPSSSCANGRKIYIKLPDGTKLILEAHTDGRNKNPVIRLYENIPNHSERDYILIDGKFKEDSFRSSKAHILANIENYIIWVNAA